MATFHYIDCTKDGCRLEIRNDAGELLEVRDTRPQPADPYAAVRLTAEQVRARWWRCWLHYDVLLPAGWVLLTPVRWLHAVIAWLRGR